MPQSLIVIVTGFPCTGKTHVAEKLATRLGLPLIAKDDIKESLFDSLGYSDRAWSQRLSGATYRILFQQMHRLATASVSFVVESNFEPSSSDDFVRLQTSTDCLFLQIHCHADGNVLEERFRQRMKTGRHPGHADPELFEEIKPRLIQGKLGALSICGTKINIDTTDLATIDHEGLSHAVESALKDRA